MADAAWREPITSIRNARDAIGRPIAIRTRPLTLHHCLTKVTRGDPTKIANCGCQLVGDSGGGGGRHVIYSTYAEKHLLPLHALAVSVPAKSDDNVAE